MIYLLGGSPSVGNSIIANQIRQKHALSVVSTDTLAKVLQRVPSPVAAPQANLASKRIMEKIGMRYVGTHADGGYFFTLTKEAYFQTKRPAILGGACPCLE